eukprot:NODE_172_length_15988_cov_0.603940.p2 type:complete len:379 gc:universal NODE_172_length_15988_cov_0.603940:1908-3044(+)
MRTFCQNESYLVKIGNFSFEVKQSMASCEVCKSPAKMLCPVCLKRNQKSYYCGRDCFGAAYSKHALTHIANPFPNYKYSGSIKAEYPLSVTRTIPENIGKPDYHLSGQPYSEIEADRYKVDVLDYDYQQRVKLAGALTREVLDTAASIVKPGTTTDEIDRVVHNKCIELECYPSPLNYYNFPKSCCTSVNEVICHGIPDQYELKDGDICNVDVSIFKNDVHGDCNDTYFVGQVDKSSDSYRLVNTCRESLKNAIDICKPGVPFRKIGEIIHDVADKNNCSVIRTYCGHGINRLFHGAPQIPHYRGSKVAGFMKEGNCFTIEPMLALGDWKDKMWPDNWTAVTQDGKRSAQFEHMLLITKNGNQVLTRKTSKDIVMDGI